MTVLVTGGAGFIGANFVLDWLAQSDETVINLDKLTYAGNLENLAALKDDPRPVVALASQWLIDNMPDTAELVVTEFGHKVKRVSEEDVEQGLSGEVDADADLQARPPVVTSGLP